MMLSEEEIWEVPGNINDQEIRSYGIESFLMEIGSYSQEAKLPDSVTVTF